MSRSSAAPQASAGTETVDAESPTLADATALAAAGLVLAATASPPVAEPLPTLRDRVAGQAGIADCLEAVAALPARTPLGRLVGLDPLTPAVRDRYEALLGELRTGEALERLGSGWTVLHSLATDDGETIDHLAIGPGGVYVLDTRVAPGRTVRVVGSHLVSDDDRMPVPALAARQAERASARLTALAGGPVEVRPIVVIARADALVTVDADLDATPVLTPDQLVRHLVRRPRVHSAAAVDYLSLLAEERETWTAEPARAEDGAGLARRFRSLQRELIGARRRAAHVRVAVVGAGMTVVSLGVGAVVAAVASAVLGA